MCCPKPVQLKMPNCIGELLYTGELPNLCCLLLWLDECAVFFYLFIQDFYSPTHFFLRKNLDAARFLLEANASVDIDYVRNLNSDFRRVTDPVYIEVVRILCKAAGIECIAPVKFDAIGFQESLFACQNLYGRKPSKILTL